MAEIYQVSSTAYSVTLQVTNLDRSYSRDDRYIDWRIFNNNVSFSLTQKYIAANAPATDPITVEGLSPLTQYAAEATIHYTNISYLDSNLVLRDVVYTQAPGTGSTRPSYFYWGTYGNAATNRIDIYYIPKAVAWNALTANINEVLAYKGKGTYHFTVAYSGTPLSAAIYNEAIVALSYIDSTVVNYAVTAGVTPLYSYYWYILQELVNSIT
jgi:hypothetical protein